jgi:hypothetical protein
MTFIADHFGAILAIIASLGTVGIIALIVVIGMPAAVILANVIGAFKAVLEFLKTPLGMAVGIVALCGLMAFAGDMHGRRSASAECKESERAAELAAAQRDLAAHKAAAAVAEKSAAELSTYSSDLEQRIIAYEAELKARPACRLDQRDADRLRELAR